MIRITRLDRFNWELSPGPEARGRLSDMEAYDRLIKMVQDAADDVAKADGGNKAAGTRVRKSMQEIKKAAQDVRIAVLSSRGETEKAAG